MSVFHDLGCEYAFECAEYAPRAMHEIKAYPANGGKFLVVINGRNKVLSHDRQTTVEILEGFRVGMAYFGRNRKTA